MTNTFRSTSTKPHTTKLTSYAKRIATLLDEPIVKTSEELKESFDERSPKAATGRSIQYVEPDCTALIVTKKVPAHAGLHRLGLLSSSGAARQGHVIISRPPDPV